MTAPQIAIDPQDIKKLKQWPWREAKTLLKSIKGRKPKSGKVLFQTGFGPSGLPHIGTFAEVARTTWVRWAFSQLTDTPTTLYAFSDNVDGLRKVPENMPNQAMLEEHLNKPLYTVPDPFGEHESYSGYMNAKLKEFLDAFDFDYEFKASSEQYQSGVFNEGLLNVLGAYEEVRDVILPTLSEEKREAWSPFMPICVKCGVVLGTKVIGTNPADGTLSYHCTHCGAKEDVPVTDGHVKVGWKVDWALRWFTFGVNYEMYGKDLIDSATLSAKICRILGERPPVGMFYEMFLDKEGRKISKSLGNGLTIDEWLNYGPLESLGLFIFKRPDRASRLHFDVIPQHVDEYLMHLKRWPEIAERTQQLNSPVWFVDHDRLEADERVAYETDLSYGTVLNLVSVLNTSDPQIVWDYILRYRPDAGRDQRIIDKMITRALEYYRDFVLPNKDHQLPSDEMRPAVNDFLDYLETCEGDEEAETLQTNAYSAGKAHGVNLRAFFKTMYQLLIGQEQGPRLGTFVQLYGVENTLELARKQLRALEQQKEES